MSGRDRALRLDDVKVRIMQEGFTAELEAEFLRSLRRVPGMWNKAQHCHLLGYELRERDYPGAVRLISIGMERFAENVQTRRIQLEMLGRVHQANGRRDMARDCYAAARELMQRERGDNAMYVTPFELRNELESTGYTWSAGVAECLRRCDAQDVLLWGLRRDALCLAAAQYLDAQQREDDACMLRAKAELMRLLYDETLTEAELVYQRHGVDVRLCPDAEQTAFLKRIGALV